MQSYLTSGPTCNFGHDPELSPLVNRLIRTANRHTGAARWRVYELAKKQISAACSATDGRHVDRQRYQHLMVQFIRGAGL